MNKKVFFPIAAFCFYVMVQAYFLYPAVILSLAPTESDDAYAYIHKAQALRECPMLSSCAAYASLMEQSKKSKIIPLAQDRYNGKLFCNYSPLHSLALDFFKFFSGNWVGSYQILQVFGALLIGVSALFFFWAIFGPVESALALLFMSAMKFPGAGILYIVPTNISLALGFLSWGFLYLKRKNVGLALSLLFAFLALLMHPIGLIYAVISLLLALQRIPNGKQQAVRIVASFLVVIVSAKILVWLLQPAGIGCSFGAKMGFSKLNIEVAIRSIGQWFAQNKGGYFFPLFFGTMGIAVLEPAKRKNILAIFAVLSAAAFLGLFYILPGYNGELVIRLMPSLGLLLNASLAAGILVAARFGSEQLKSKKFGKEFWMVFALLLGMSLDRASYLKLGLTGDASKWESLRFWRLLITPRVGPYWEEESIKNILSLVPPDAQIGFDHETNIYNALASGLNARKIVFLPYQTESEANTEWKDKLSYFVVQNPVAAFSLKDGDVSFEGMGKQNKFSVLVENRGLSQAEWSYLVNEKTNKAQISPRKQQWIQISEVSDKIIFPQVNSPLIIKGLKLGDNQKTHWPWNQGIIATQKGKKTEISSKNLYCYIDCPKSPKVLSDLGNELLLGK